MRRSIVLLASLVAVGAAAQDPSTRAAPDAASVVPERSPADVARRARLYARIGDAGVTVGDIEDAIAAQTEYQRQRYRDDPEALRELAHRLVDLQVLAREARRRELDRERAVREVVEGNLVQLLVRREIDERITPRSIPDAEVATYYQSHLEQYARPEMVRASHVLVATAAEATALVAQCRAGDIAAFRQLARDRSLDGETKQSGGDLRYFTRDGRPMGDVGRPVEQALVNAAFALREVGDCSAEPVPVGERWSVLKLTGRRAAETTPLPAASEGIRRSLWREKRDAELERLVATIRARVAVSQRNELVRLVEMPAPEPGELGRHQHGEPSTLPEAHREGRPE